MLLISARLPLLPGLYNHARSEDCPSPVSPAVGICFSHWGRYHSQRLYRAASLPSGQQQLLDDFITTDVWRLQVSLVILRRTLLCVAAERFPSGEHTVMSEGGQGLTEWVQQVMRASPRTFPAAPQQTALTSFLTVVRIGGSAVANGATGCMLPLLCSALRRSTIILCTKQGCHDDAVWGLRPEACTGLLYLQQLRSGDASRLSDSGADRTARGGGRCRTGTWARGPTRSSGTASGCPTCRGRRTSPSCPSSPCPGSSRPLVHIPPPPPPLSPGPPTRQACAQVGCEPHTLHFRMRLGDL